MNLYSKMLNIQNIDTEDLIKSAISEVKNELQGLSPERMCLVFSSYLYNALLKRHLLVHMIDTHDLGTSYQHRFVVVYNGINYYLCDLTYSMFQNSLFPELLSNGYMKCDSNSLKSYLEIITREDVDLSIDEVFNTNNNLGR